jgi:hypothetical protein
MTKKSMFDGIWDELPTLLEKLPQGGGISPQMERIEPPEKKVAPNTKVYVQKLKTIVYIYTDKAGKQHGEQSSQTLSILGNMTIFEALEAFKNDPDVKDS